MSRTWTRIVVVAAAWVSVMTVYAGAAAMQGHQGETECSDIVDVPAKDVPNQPYSCQCTLLGWVLSSVPCQKSIDTYPAHQKCQGSSLVVDCEPDDEMPVTRQSYKCLCEVTGPDVQVGNIKVGIGVAVAKCEPEGGPQNAGTVTDAMAEPCHVN